MKAAIGEDPRGVPAKLAAVCRQVAIGKLNYVRVLATIIRRRTERNYATTFTLLIWRKGIWRRWLH